MSLQRMISTLAVVLLAATSLRAQTFEDGVLMPGKALFNARLTYDNDAYDFSVALGVTNLFDKFYYVNVFDYQGLGYPQTDAQPAAPREWYLTLSKRF